MRTALAAALCCSMLWAGTQPKSAPDQYPVHGKTAELAIGAEYMVQSLTTPHGTFIADRYLVVSWQSILRGPAP